MQILDPASDALGPRDLALRCIRQRMGFAAVLMLVATAAAAAAVLCRQSAPAPSVPVVIVAAALGLALTSAPVLVLLFAPPQILISYWTHRIEMSRREGKPIGAFSRTFLALVFAGAVVFAAGIAAAIALRW